MWCPELVRDKNVQRRSTRLFFGRMRPNYAERLHMAEIQMFENRRLRGDMIICFRILKYNFGNLKCMFIVDSENRLRGHKWKPKKEQFFTKTRQFFLFNRIF